MRLNTPRIKANQIVIFILLLLPVLLAIALLPLKASAAPQLPIGKFYSVEPAGSIQRLISIDPQTLQVATVLTLTGDTGFRSNTIAFSPDGELYGWDNNQGRLYTIDLNTGVVTHVGLPTIYHSLNGMAFDKNGNLYGLVASTDELLSIDKTTSAVTPIGPLGIDIRHHGMAIDFLNNQLYGVSGAGADVDKLFKINKQIYPFFLDDFSTNTTADYTWTYRDAGTSRTWNSAGYMNLDGYSGAWQPAYAQGERTVANIPASGYAKIKFNIRYNGIGQSRIHFYIKQDDNNWYRFAGTDAVLGSSGFTEGVEKKVGGVAERYTDQNTTSINPGGDGWSGNQSYVMQVWWSPTKIKMAINGVIIREATTSNATPIIPTSFAIKAYRFIADIDSIEIYSNNGGLAEVIGPLGVDTGGVGLEFSPVTGDLYSLRNNNQLMKVDINTGHATNLGTLAGVNSVNLAAQWPPPNQAPIAAIDAPVVGDEGSPITVSAAASSDPDNDTLQYRWDFDNNGIWDTAWSNSSTAIHTWNDDYSGTIALEVSDGTLTDSSTTTVTVNNVAPTLDIGPDLSANEGAIMGISSFFSDPGAADTHTAWIDWGDGTPISFIGPAISPTILNHIYVDNGIYTVTFNVVDDDGGTAVDSLNVTVNNLPPEISAANNGPKNEGETFTIDTSVSDPGILDTFTYSFDFNNDGIYEIIDQSSSTATHTWNANGTYTVGVRVKDNDGGVAVVTTDVAVNDLAPYAEFISSPAAQNEGSPMLFNDMSTSSPDNIISWAWDFGDGSTATTQNPTHVYADNNIYTVTLTVTDSDGSTATISHNATISNVAPVVDAGNDTTDKVGANLNFAGNFTDPGVDDTHTFVWDFGDGTTATVGSLTPTHIYSVSGTYTVTLTVTDDDGGVGTDTLTVVVNEPTPPPCTNHDDGDDDKREGKHDGHHYEHDDHDEHESSHCRTHNDDDEQVDEHDGDDESNFSNSRENESSHSEHERHEKVNSKSRKCHKTTSDDNR